MARPVLFGSARPLAQLAGPIRLRRLPLISRPVRVHTGRSRTVKCFASFLPDDLDDILATGTIVASGLAILGTAALAARSPKKPPPPEEDVSQYGIMTVVSCIPLFSWTAWILPALQNPDRAALFYTYAALYSYPLLKDGFDIEGYTLVMLLLGIIHVQVERIAATEPETFQGNRPIAAVLGVVAVLAEQVTRFTGALLGILASDTKQAIRGGSIGDERNDGRLPSGRQSWDDESLSSGEELELKEFDRRMLARQADKRRRQNKNKGGSEY